jgi:excisionase family DNA binding protein
LSDAAALLGIGRTSVYYLVRDGEIGSVLLRGRRLIPRTELESLVEHLRAAS